MAEKKTKVKPKVFFIWHPTRPAQRVDPRRCRHLVRHRSRTHQCEKRVVVRFRHPDEEEPVGSCIPHNPYYQEPKKPKTRADRNLAGRVTLHHAKTEKHRKDVTAMAIAWGAAGYKHSGLEKLRKTMAKYFRHVDKGEPKK